MEKDKEQLKTTSLVFTLAGAVQLKASNPQ
jgi:hypothetical protein